MTTPPARAVGPETNAQREGLDPARAVLVVRGLAAAVVLLAAVVLGFGWGLGIEAARSLVPGLVPMAPLTGVGLFLAGGSLLLLAHQDVRRWPLAAGMLLAGLVFALATAVLAEYLLALDTGVERVLFWDAVRRRDLPMPGLPAPNTAAGLLLIGGSLLLVGRGRRSPRSGLTLALLAGLIAIQALIGYGLGVEPLYRVSAFSPIAVNTAFGILLLATGLLYTRPERGLVRLLHDHGPGGAITRRLLPVAVLVPVIVGWLELQGERMGLYGSEVGTSLIVLAALVVTAGAVWKGSALLVQLERRRQEGERERERLLVELERLLTLERAARDTAEEANRVKAQFLSTMSHELRTPLNAIIGYAELLEVGAGSATRDGGRQYVDRIRLAAIHQKQLIEDILTFSRLQAGREVAQVEDVPVPELLREIEAVLGPLAAQKGLDLLMDDRAAPTLIRTDARKLRQILVNLLGNAVKFTADGHVRLVIDSKADFVRFVVEDTGVGIASEHHEDIFDAFWQGDRTLTRSAEGSGLGLSISRRLATLLGGRIVVDSEQGQGSRFTLLLPRVPEGGDQMEAAPADDVPAAQPVSTPRGRTTNRRPPRDTSATNRTTKP